MGIPCIKFRFTTTSQEGVQEEGVPKDISHSYNVLFLRQVSYIVFFTSLPIFGDLNKMKMSFGF